MYRLKKIEKLIRIFNFFNFFKISDRMAEPPSALTISAAQWPDDTAKYACVLCCSGMAWSEDWPEVIAFLIDSY